MSVTIDGTNGVTWTIESVQVEKGSNATSFDQRSYGTELALCQRYYFRKIYENINHVVATCQAYASGSVFGKLFDLPVEMRAIPTCAVSSIGHFSGGNSTGSISTAFTGGGPGQGISKTQITTGAFTGSSGMTAGNAANIFANNAGSWIDASAEL